jgi:hypothetical protein
MSPKINTLKTIIIIILAVLVTLSLAFNTFILTILEIKDVESFKQVILCRELLMSMSQIPEDNSTVETTTSTGVNTNPEPVPDNQNSTTNTPMTDNIIYEDSYIKVTYVKQELSIFGPTIKFLIENLSSKAVDISFTDVHIDGYKVDLCSIYVDSLEVGKKSFETLYLYESDYEDFTSYPSMVEFTIIVRDPASWTELSASDVIYINIDK